MENGKWKMDNEKDVLRDKSYAFALRTVNLYKYLTVEKKEYVLSKQALRSGTSIGANIAEGNQGQSKLDFIHKLSISLKGSFETRYWLDLLRDGGYLEASHAEWLINDCCELQKILTASVKTAKANQGKL